ncbi:tetratricopeptide repeat protein [Nostoc sp. DedQUE09]|uniref:tetratricopeptide repeat protein n=1 Tax=Nostoc sp. DedQUE09 TaxID=3075394 RepID=UPI002AD2D5CA|nr:tetratricopeptide repeat protein [Nostoc sp. DedQUE09]MDZ7953469.1 tetratricopeptide repeat protein [Nostoc sp. DedQUE09]
MNPNLSDWDDDLPPEPEEAYQDLIRALKRKSGFGLFFVQCTPVEADNFIVKLPQEIPHKKIAVLPLVEAIDNLYQPVAEFVKDKQIDILLIKGLEYSLYKYEKRSFGEITEGQFSNLTSVPHILNHLNQQRERFRDDFKISFVFLLRSFSINYFIHRAPDFFDWRSGVFELPTTQEVVDEESSRLLDEAGYEEYLKLSHEKKIEKLLEIKDMLTEKFQTKSRKPSLLCEMGKLLVSANENEVAITSYDEAVKIQPDYHQAWYNRGIALGNLGLYKLAISSYDEAVKIKPNYHDAWYNRGIMLVNLGYFEAAIASYEEALKIKNDYYEAWNNKGNLLLNLERFEAAITSYEEALKIKPNSYLIWNNRGIALVKIGYFEAAITSYEEALKIKQDYHLAWYGKGNALANLGHTEAAITCYEEAVKIQPDYHLAWYSQGNVLDNLGRYEEAIRCYEEALTIKLDDYLAWYDRGIALESLGNYELAITSYDQALKIKPDDYLSWYAKGYASRNLERYQEAIISFEQALQFKPDNHEAWYNKACCYALQGNIKQALKNLEKVIHMSPDKYREMAKTNSDFDSIWEDERFQTLIQ